MALFDTLQVTTELVQAGIERMQAESIAKVQGDTVTKDYLDLWLSEMSANIKADMTNLKSDMNSLRTELRNELHNLSKEINGIKLESLFHKVDEQGNHGRIRCNCERVNQDCVFSLKAGLVLKPAFA